MTATSLDLYRGVTLQYIRDRMTLQPVPALFALLAAIFVLLTGGSAYGAASVGLFVYSMIWYADSLGREMAIVPVIAVIATGQWLLGPYLAYQFDAGTDKYMMYVDESVYFSFALPGLLAFLLALEAFSLKVDLGQLSSHLRSSVPLGPGTIRMIFVVGLIAGLLPASGDLRFVLYLISQFTFVSLFYMLTYRIPGRWVALTLAFVWLAVSSAEVGLFHNILLWSSLLASPVFFEFRLSLRSKLLLVLLATLIVVQLQAAKSEYREIIASDPNRASVVTLIDTMQGTNLELSDLSINARLNEGWIISAVMAHVPEREPHQNGRTIYEAVLGSIVPRFLMEKREVSVSEAFRTYTGLLVNDDTSLGISVLGESWVNFGYYGILFMGLFGAMYGFFMRGVLRISRRYPTFVLWMPLFFLQAIKMETELIVVLNHIVKSGIFVLVIYILTYQFFRLRL